MTEVKAEPQERVTVVREFAMESLEEGDGRTIDARIVPYNTPTMVSDPPTYEKYEETWLPGCFDAQTRAANRVKLLINVEHEQGIRGVIGHGTELDDRDDALYGTFRIHEDSDGEKALGLVREGILDGISLEAVVLRSRRNESGVERVRAHLDKIALCRRAAFSEAQVLAVRQEQAVVSPVIMGPFMSEEVSARLEAIGLVPLVSRAVTKKPWDGSPSRFTDEEYQRSCLIDRGGDAPPKSRCSLPVLEPNGDVNANALSAAAAALAGARGGLSNVSVSMKASAARKLMRYYRQAGMPAPPSLMKMAGR